VNVNGYSWVGVGTDSFEETVSFFSNVMGLPIVVVDDRGVAMLKVSDGQFLEVFGPGTQGRELTAPPVVAFEVDDVGAAREELIAQGIEVLGDTGSWNGFEWLKFRGPEGHIYALQKTPPAGWEETE
jgi:catechol 2,3-dioxygenase-like lactoylglutathione lyase family enzyme